MARAEVMVMPDYILCEISGKFESETSTDNFFQIIDLCRTSGRSGILMDMRKMDGIPDATERIIFMEKIINQHDIFLKFNDEPLRLALLAKKDVVGSYTPGMDVAKTRGFLATATSDENQAIAWLKEFS